MSNPSSISLADLLRALLAHHIGPVATEKDRAEETQRFNELIAKLEKAEPESRKALWDEYMRPQRQRSQEKSLQPKRRTPWQQAIRHLHKKAGIKEGAVREFLCKRKLAEMQGMDLALAEDGSEDLADDLADLECDERAKTLLIQLLRHKFPKEMAAILRAVTGKNRGRHALNPKEEEKRNDLISQWERFRDGKHGQQKDFCQDNHVSLKDLNRALAWARTRRNRSK
jgi:hypothetical protein